MPRMRQPARRGIVPGIACLLAVAAVAGAPAGAPAAVAAANAFSVTALAPNVYAHRGKLLALDAPGHDDIANLGFVIGARCVAVIDTGGSVRIGRALRAAIRARTPLPICYVIDTHVHVDHVLGNAAFKDDKPQFVGHALLAAALVRSRDLFLRDYAADLDAPASADQIIAPDLVVEDSLELDLGGRSLQLRAWPKAHTDCDLTVFDGASGTLFAGDLLFRERVPALDGSATGWLAAIDVLRAVKARRVVPGHGPVATDPGAAFAPERQYLQVLVDDVRAAIAGGQSMSAALGQVGASEQSQWRLWETAHAHNVARVYQELEWE